MSHFRVRVEKDYLVFCAAHFITYNGDACERLHGHNYRVAAEVTGPLDANHYVFDFIALKDHLAEIVGELDHRMLVPTESDLIRLEAGDKSVRLKFDDREWVFPREDCVLLPIANTTAELLACHIATTLLGVLKRHHDFEPEWLSLDVEESFGQLATYEWRRG